MDKDIDEFYRGYFRDKLRRFGDTPMGVDWKDKESQHTRFSYIYRLMLNQFPDFSGVSILDVGCGYGAFYQYLKKTQTGINYFGIDLLDEMTDNAKRLFPDKKDSFFTGDFKNVSFHARFDFVTSSGIFNVKGQFEDLTFENYILQSIEAMFHLCNKGVVFNLMTPAPEYKEPKLFYPSLDTIFSFIYKRLSRNIVINSSYPLWEVTVGIFK